MTCSLRPLPRLIDLAARAYAQGRLDASKRGDRWVSVEAFAKQALDDGVFGTQSLQALYSRMLVAGTHVYGGGS